MTRYETMFDRLDGGAFVPFLMLGDPNAEDTLEIVRTVVEAGADALELGIPFSDPVADGPTIQASHVRAMESGATVDGALVQIRQIRHEFPDLPIGLLVYGNLIFARESFYRDFADAGADSILVPDFPVREGEPFAERAVEAGIDPIFIAPARASEKTLEGVARLSRGYIYAISRDGVTGTESEASSLGLDEVVANVQRFGGAPVLLGFGISEPRHVREAIEAGAAGAITGSAITAIIEKHLVDGASDAELSGGEGTGAGESVASAAGDTMVPGDASAHAGVSHPAKRDTHDGSDQGSRVRDMAALKAELSEYVRSMKEATHRP